MSGAAPPLAAVRWRPFRLPLREPIATARGAIAERAGVILELRDGEGRRGYGEASPLPADGGGGADGVLRLLGAHARALLDAGRPPDGLRGPGAAALRCAADAALLDLEGQRRGVPIAALLAAKPAAGVAVNAVAGDGPPALVRARARAAAAAGYGTLKLKAGAASPDGDAARAGAAREAAPDARLRIDANGAWDEATAAAALDRLAPLGVEYAEQPLPAGDLAGMARLRARGPCRVAADESAGDRESALRVLEAGAADVLVLKPMRLGGLRPALGVARRAAERGAACVVTTTFDSALGVAAALQLAAALAGEGLDGGLAHGLATTELLGADLAADPPLPRRGALRLPPDAGLGARPGAAALGAAATGGWRGVRR